MKLNGWQRLWVVFTVAWTLAVCLVGYANWPRPTDYLRALEAGEETRERLASQSAAKPTVSNEAPGSSRPPDLDAEGNPLPPRTVTRTVNELIAAGAIPRGEEESTEAALARLVERLDSERQALRDDRVEHAGVTLMAWAIPPALLYALGLAVGWVRRGFTG